MNAVDVIRQTNTTSQMVVKAYVEDLSDADLMRRPAAGCNHLAWQLGHLISSECMLLNSLAPGAAPELPAGFAEQHAKDKCGSDDPSQFCTKAQYLELWGQVQAAMMGALDHVSESDLDKPGPENMQPMFPTAGAVWVLLATHALMHAGQFVPVRRALGKPVVI
ncbi:DinB superfamily protein [Pirellulimonas nuda]|uniref:DinB superfamily protein n=1 Tax=Pirellulimonas nuda TaxID=2528009 RepID=A0A518D869_9BACT|nr:DinB family protein [Pirellulimonas nuda]QDU87645.1 DinB superfamily protein [Pirellulimonas nuda]